MSVLSILVGINVRQRLRPRRHRAGPTPRITDAQVLEARVLHEQRGLTTKQVLRHFGIECTHNTQRWMCGILRYEQRSSPTKPLDPNLEAR